MANYCALARSNYFTVKDRSAFETYVADVNLELITNRDGQVGVMNAGSLDGAGWPCQRYDESTDDYVDIDVFADIAEHLSDGQVAIFIEIGWEKMRYLVGHAVAINNAGECETVDLNEINGHATRLGTDTTAAEY